MQIPPHAKLAFKGQIFDIYQWEQEMYDGSKELFEAIRRPDTVQVIPLHGDKIYLSYEEQPGRPLQLTFFGGRVEKDEDPLEAAKRELLEETGMKSGDWELYKEYKSNGKIDWTTYLYIARSSEKVTQPHLDPGEKIDVKEFSFDEFIDIISDESFWNLQISNDILRFKQDKQKLVAFKNRLFTGVKA